MISAHASLARIWVPAASYTAVLMPISTGPYSTSLARLLHASIYRSPKGTMSTTILSYEGKCGLRTAYVPHYTTPEVH